MRGWHTPQLGLYLQHGALHQIGFRPLDRHIRRGPLGRLAYNKVTAVNIGRWAPAAKICLHIPVAARLRERRVDKLSNRPAQLKIVVDKLFRRRKCHAGSCRQPVRTHAVEYAEINHFGVAALCFCHLTERHAIHVTGGFGMNVYPGVEIIDQYLVAHAQRSYYEEMLQAGVEIYLYKPPTLLHSKYMLVDDDLSLVGSSNMDIRSFELNHELTLLTYDTAVAARLAATTDEYLARSTRLSKHAWLVRPRRKQLLDNLARLTSALQ